MQIVPTFEREEGYWGQQLTVAGVDEAGMGALAGPVVAGAVLFTAGIVNGVQVVVRDSKTLSEKQRNEAADWVREHALAWAVGEASVEEISELNIRRASHLAMQRAIDQLKPAPDCLVIDGTAAEVHPAIPAEAIVDGDAHVFSIAAAGIIAKVHRDEVMEHLDRVFEGFSFAQHKGYGTHAHMEALRSLGPSPAHRPTYAPIAALTPLDESRP